MAKARLLSLLRKTVDDRLTRFVWLRQFEPGSNSADMNRMLDRLNALRELDIDPRILEGVPPHRVGRLRRLPVSWTVCTSAAARPRRLSSVQSTFYAPLTAR